jgi:hypothetical protein
MITLKIEVNGDEIHVRGNSTDEIEEHVDRATRDLASRLGGMIVDSNTHLFTYRERIARIEDEKPLSPSPLTRP